MVARFSAVGRQQARVLTPVLQASRQRGDRGGADRAKYL